MTSPKEPHTVWPMLASQLGAMPDGEVQRICIEEGLIDALRQAQTDPARAAAYARLLVRVGQLQAPDLQGAGAPLLPAASRNPDPRWQLLADLSARAEWPLYQPTLFQPHIQGGGDHPLPRSNSVEIRFDDRFTLEAAVSAIRERWPDLVRLGVVRSRPRRMKDNTVQLLRFVCLETDLGDSWEARWRAWEARYGKRGKGWTYRTRRAFISDVHRAEQSLVGHSRGLAWFYEPIAREDRQQLLRRADKDAAAAREVQRREDMGWRSLKDADRRTDQGAASSRRHKDDG